MEQVVGSKRSLWWMAVPAFTVCAPLVAVAAVFMAYKLGFFIGGSALAGILASGFSYILYKNRERGAHAANMGQTAASAAGSIAGIIGILLQAYYWLGVGDNFSLLNNAVFTLSASMLGVGIGMLYTPLLVDRMKLPYPTGRAVFEILRAMMTWQNFKKAIAWLGGSIGGSILITMKTPIALAKVGFDASVFGAGMIAGPRIAIPGLVMGLIGLGVAPMMMDAGWLKADQEFRHIGFYAGLAMMLGAAVVHIVQMIIQAWQEMQSSTRYRNPIPKWVVFWTFIWIIITLLVGVFMMNIQPGYLITGVLLAFIFVLVNGISTGISDANPVTAAFVLSVFFLALVLSIDNKIEALIASSVLLYAISAGVDMQQDRSTGWRLGSNRTTQFKFQVVGVVMGILFGFLLAPYFLSSYPELMDPTAKTTDWSSAFTMKIVGSLNIIDGYKPYQFWLLGTGLILGVLLQLLRIKFKSAINKSFILDAIILPSPYAFAFGSFVPFFYAGWFCAGGVLTGVINGVANRQKRTADGEHEEGAASAVPALVGGGLIAGAGLTYLLMGFMKFVS